MVGKEVPQPSKSLWGAYNNSRNDEIDPSEIKESEVVSQLPNRKEEVDAAIADVDFEKKNYQIVLDTTVGEIKLDLWPDVAPGHCKNIIGLTKIGYYDGIIFHRVIKDFVCQVGCPLGTGTGGPGYTIDAEFNDKKHEAGVLSMARTNDPNSAGSQFFICLGRVPHLDNKYTVFGKTADEASLKNVLKFNSVRTGAGDRPVEEIKIKSAKVIETEK
ncbi:MAG: peptidylprolyl isomerase [Planctomycetaceae bacterium]|nr:peptidylprolyl isomerase [Planctomycetaceae bacterium]